MITMSVNGRYAVVAYSGRHVGCYDSHDEAWAHQARLDEAVVAILDSPEFAATEESVERFGELLHDATQREYSTFRSAARGFIISLPGGRELLCR